jgi:hypothetical protein
MLFLENLLSLRIRRINFSNSHFETNGGFGAPVGRAKSAIGSRASSPQVSLHGYQWNT